MTPSAQLLTLLLAPAVPLALAVAIMVRPGAEMPRRMVGWAALPALVISLAMSPGIAATVPWVLEGSEFGLDETGRVFLLSSAALWLAAGTVAPSWVERPRARFLVFFLLTMSGSLGIAIARDVLSFYLFFALMSFASYGLVVHDASTGARRAGAVYMALVLAGDMMLFAGLLLIVHDAGGQMLFESVRGMLPTVLHGQAALALVLVGFGVKVGVLGLHVALPLIYGAAPIPGAVVLSGAVINGGLLGWLRILPVGAGEAAAWGAPVAAAGMAAAFYGALVGVLQRRPAPVLAYSSISQMGIMTMAVGVSLTVPDPHRMLTSAIVLFALHHAFAKGALFFGLGVAERGVGRGRLLVGLGLLLPALALAGAPFTTGMLAKETLKEALALAPSPWRAVTQAALPWMSVATTLVLARFLWLAWPRPRPRPEPGPRKALGRPGLLGWLGLLGLTAVAAWTVPVPHPDGLWSTKAVWAVTWPVLLGGGLAGLALHPRITLPRWRIPAGDVLVWALVVLDRVGRVWRALAQRSLPATRAALLGAGQWLASKPGWGRRAGAAETLLLAWRTAGVLLVLAIVVLWLVALPG
ncbi:MAG: proton-conducting transporter membrane subunit [Pseudomonadota bacterium]